MTSFGVETSEDFYSIGSMLADLHQHLLSLRAYQTALRIDRLYALDPAPYRGNHVGQNPKRVEVSLLLRDCFLSADVATQLQAVLDVTAHDRRENF